MKPTFQISRPVRRGDSQHAFGHNLPKSPTTDWSFQAPATQLRTGGSSFQRLGARSPLTHRFRALSDGFFATEAKRESRLEGALFAVIAALAAWPMVLAAQAAVALMK